MILDKKYKKYNKYNKYKYNYNTNIIFDIHDINLLY